MGEHSGGFRGRATVYRKALMSGRLVIHFSLKGSWASLDGWRISVEEGMKLLQERVEKEEMNNHEGFALDDDGFI